ncbi:hypothetical protein PVL29_012920 [Vitis rotundifolia]|uniref:Di19 zinc-binding domain-containing protein n=1 Tax=Vitis rotundifolia TaxID=103349 RepID=A0AA39DP22_VITRO|nr:hypothetical protein PVL29_012920 [Vitis rotundifolia]
MNTDFWASRLAAAKRQYALQHHHNTSQLDRLSIDDFEVEDEARPDFPCPYCYEDYDIASLCSHLEDEHSCESRVTSCQLPSSQALSLLGRDLLEAHLQVASSFDPSLSYEERERRMRQAAGRAGFVQDILLSTLLAD